jgi:hypothetical protein
MDRVLDAPSLDRSELFSQLSDIREEFREEVLLRQLIDTLDVSSKKLLASLALHKLPVSAEVLRRHIDGVVSAGPVFPLQAFDVDLKAISTGVGTLPVSGLRRFLKGAGIRFRRLLGINRDPTNT